MPLIITPFTAFFHLFPLLVARAIFETTSKKEISIVAFEEETIPPFPPTFFLRSQHRGIIIIPRGLLPRSVGPFEDHFNRAK